MNNEPNYTAPEPSSQPEQQSPSPVCPPQPKQTVRRVGTLTMGFALIAAGIIALIAIFTPSFHILTILKLAPMLLIFLGIEVLAGYFFSRGARIKYDFLSGFVCFILICGAMGMSVVPIAWQYFGAPATQLREQLKTDAKSALAAKLSDFDQIKSLYTNAYLPHYIKGDTNLSTDLLAAQTNLYITIDLAGPYADSAAFSEDCAAIIARIRELPQQLEGVDFSFSDSVQQMQLALRGEFQMNMDANALNRLVDTVYYEEEMQEHVPEDVPVATAEEPSVEITIE